MANSDCNNGLSFWEGVRVGSDVDSYQFDADPDPWSASLKKMDPDPNQNRENFQSFKNFIFP